MDWLLTTLFIFLCMIGGTWSVSGIRGGLSGKVSTWMAMWKMLVGSAALGGAVILAGALW